MWKSNIGGMSSSPKDLIRGQSTSILGYFKSYKLNIEFSVDYTLKVLDLGGKIKRTA